MGMLEGKVAIVTGAGGGLGECHAKLLAQEGASVVINDLGGTRDGSGAGSDMADKVVEEIKAAGGNAVADYGNVTVEEDANKMVRTAVDNFGKLDFFIANAGILRDKSFKNMDNAMWDAVVNVHLRGTYLTVKAAYNQMINQETGGSIVVTSSTSGLLGNFGQSNYGAAKAGIAGFARCLFQEGLKYGVRVNVLAPAAWSRMTADIFPEGQNMEELLSPDKVSPLVVWLGRCQGRHRPKLHGRRQQRAAPVLAGSGSLSQGQHRRAMDRSGDRRGSRRKLRQVAKRHSTHKASLGVTAHERPIR